MASGAVVQLSASPTRLGRGDATGQTKVRTFGVVDLIEAVELFLQLLEVLRQGLLVEKPEQGLVEAFMLALHGRFIRFAGDRLHASEVT